MGVIDLISVASGLATSAALVLLWRQTRDVHRFGEVAALLEFERQFDGRVLLKARLDALDCPGPMAGGRLPVTPQLVLDFLQAVAAASSSSVVRSRSLADRYGWWMVGYRRALSPYLEAVRDREKADYWPDFERLADRLDWPLIFQSDQGLQRWKQEERRLIEYRMALP